MPGKQSFWNRELDPQKGYWIIQQLSTLAFTLSGFSLTSLSFFIGFYSTKPEEAGILVPVLFGCSIAFMLSGEMAREGYKIWKYLVSEAIYLLALLALVLSFWTFAAKFPSLGNPVVTTIIIVTVLYFAYRVVHNAYVTIKVR